jgi:hypothetical protein
LSLAVAGLMLGGCAQGGGEPLRTPAPVGSTDPSPVATPAPTPTPQPGVTDLGDLPPVPDNKAPGSGKPIPGQMGTPMRLTGVVTPGVEANCILLNGYLLIGGPRELLRGGATVTVTGRVQAGLLTTCQQGTPFVVETAMRGE